MRKKGIPEQMVPEKKYKRLEKSKNNLDNKYKALKKDHKYKTASLKYNKDQNKKHQKTIKEKDEIIKKSKKKTDELENKLAARNTFSDDIIILLCVSLFTACGISFRSIPKILQIVFFYLNLNGWIPHETSIMIWVKKLSLYKLNSIKKDDLGKKFCDIIDITVTKNSSKLLAILRVPLDIYRNGQGGLKSSEVETIGIYAEETWNKFSIFERLNSLFSKIGYPAQLLTPSRPQFYTLRFNSLGSIEFSMSF